MPFEEKVMSWHNEIQFVIVHKRVVPGNMFTIPRSGAKVSAHRNEVESFHLVPPRHLS